MKKAAAVGLILQVPPHPVGSLLLPVEGVSEPRTRRRPLPRSWRGAPLVGFEGLLGVVIFNGQNRWQGCPGSVALARAFYDERGGGGATPGSNIYTCVLGEHGMSLSAWPFVRRICVVDGRRYLACCGGP